MFEARILSDIIVNQVRLLAAPTSFSRIDGQREMAEEPPFRSLHMPAVARSPQISGYLRLHSELLA